jgi:formate transporter
MAWASRQISIRELLRNWGIVYMGNLAGSLATALLMLFARQYLFSNGAVGLNILTIADYKCGLPFTQAMTLGIFCNALVCMAVWLCFSCHSTTDRILAIIFPITAFVAGGFEHSVANMYFIPMGLLVKTFSVPEFWVLTGRTAADFGALNLANFLFKNLLPVTLGNIFGGSVMVGLVYWFIYIRKPRVSPFVPE